MEKKFFGPDDVTNANAELYKLVNTKFESGDFAPHFNTGVEMKIDNLSREYSDKQLSDFCDFYKSGSKWPFIYAQPNYECYLIWFIFSQVKCDFVKI